MQDYTTKRFVEVVNVLLEYDKKLSLKDIGEQVLNVSNISTTMNRLKNGQRKLAHDEIQRFLEKYKHVNPEYLNASDEEADATPIFKESFTRGLTGLPMAGAVYTPALSGTALARLVNVIDAIVSRTGLNNVKEWLTKHSLHRGRLTDIKGGKVKELPADMARALLKENVNLMWLLYGEGERFTESVSIKQIRGQESRPAAFIPPVIIEKNNPERANIVFVPVKVAAGYANHLGDTEFYESLPTGYLPIISDQKQYNGFTVEGNSMFDTLSDGDYVIASFVHPDDWVDIDNGHVYVIIRDGLRPQVKRIKNRIKRDEKIILVSDNRKEFRQSEHVPISEVREIWKPELKLQHDLGNPSNYETRISNIEIALEQIARKLGIDPGDIDL